MTGKSLEDRTVRALRTAALILGCLALLIAVLADSLGLSAGQSLSRNQISIGILCILLIVAGILGRRFAGIYRSAGLLLLNLLILLMLLDLAALIVIKIWNPPQMAYHREKVIRGSAVRPVEEVSGSRYASYVVWRALPNQDAIRTDSFGHRITPGSCQLSDEKGIRFFLLGGSTSWGLGVADSATIAFHLVCHLQDSLGIEVELLNLSQIGWNSSQELFDLILELRRGNVPDVVVCLDGFNEVFTAYQSGMAGVHQNFLQTAALMENRIRYPGLLEQIWAATNTSLLVDLITHRGVFAEESIENMETYRTMGVDAEHLAAEIVDVCLSNYSVIRHLGESYGFQSIFVWQPAIWMGSKHLTPEEEDIASGTAGYVFTGDPAFRLLLLKTYDLYRDSCEVYSDLFVIADVFDIEDHRMYTDPSGVHVNGAGNELIASKLCTLILTRAMTSGDEEGNPVQRGTSDD